MFYPKQFLRIIPFLFLLALPILLFAATTKTTENLKIWFNKPASNWNEALPVGNGRLGAMIFGGIAKERLQLNEESVWTGKHVDRSNPGAEETLDEVRKLLFESKYVEGQNLAQEKIMGKRLPTGAHTYQTLGNLNLNFGLFRRVTDYRRELDLETAVARVSFKANGVIFTREIFSSAPAQALVVRLTANRPGSINFTASLSRPSPNVKIEIVNGEILMHEHVGNGDGVKLVTRLKVLNESGSLTLHGERIQIKDANAATLILTAATDYRGSDPYQETETQLTQAAEKSYARLKDDHTGDYQKYFKRVDLDFGDTDAVYFPTDVRISAVQNGYEDPELFKLYYQFGRYLLISSSRPGCLPANLQGLWADGLKPPWNADYHININIQMNYWPAEITNLAEMHQPFLNFLDELRPNARQTARETYGCRGIVAHHTTDVWHFTDPIGKTQYGMWPMGLAWSSQHFWEHFLFNGNQAYLRNSAYPFMKEAAEFCLDWLVVNPKTGYLVSGPSISPENKFRTKDGKIGTVVMGPTMDHMIIRDLFENTIAASRVLGIDASFRKKLQKSLEKLTPTQIGSDGRILEWSQEFEEPEPGHRHISHLFGLHPGKQITRQHTPALFRAAAKTIEYRLAHGGGHTGWSRAWIINFYARLQEGDKAYQNLLALLRKSTLPNLFDNHPPFQIDGNFGGTAGITEMLLQSHTGEIQLLPALPSAWPDGYIHGVCARGGFELNIDWQNGKLKKVDVFSKLGNKCKIRYGDKLTSFDTKKGENYSFTEDLGRLE